MTTLSRQTTSGTPTRYITVGNKKGGVLKTTTVVTLGHALALRGKRVLLVDTDAQGHVAECLGIERVPGFFNLITGATLDDVIVASGRANLDIVPGDNTTAKALELLTTKKYREQILDRALQQAEGRYDFVICDSSPGTDIIVDNTIVAAREYVIPAQVDYLALKGVADYIESVNEHCLALGRVMHLTAVIPTLWDSVTGESATNLVSLQQAFGDAVTTPVPRSVAGRRAPGRAQTVIESEPDSKVAAAYTMIANHVLKHAL